MKEVYLYKNNSFKTHLFWETQYYLIIMSDALT